MQLPGTTDAIQAAQGHAATITGPAFSRAPAELYESAHRPKEGAARPIARTEAVTDHCLEVWILYQHDHYAS